MATRHNLDSEDDGTSTQPVTSCCSEQEQNVDEQLEEPIQIHASYDNVSITWNNSGGQPQSIDNILLKVDIDSLTSKAIFRVICRLWLKGKGKNRTQLKGIHSQAGDKQPVFLFLHPENIRVITLEDEHGNPSLHFCVDRGGSRLVIPSDCILECKNSMQTRFLSMRALADTSDLMIHFKDADMSKATRDHLFQIASIFSASNTKRPETDHRRIDLQSLYSGIGGHIFDTSTTVAGGSNEADQALPEDTSAPPPFDNGPSREHKHLRKRKREREPDRESSDADYDPSLVHDSSSTRASRARSSDMKDLLEHLFNMESRIKNTIESSEKRVRDDMKEMIESSEDRLKNHVKDVVEATESRLKDELNDMLDSRADDIDRRIDGSMDELRTECIGTIESEFSYLKYGIEEVTKGIDEAEEKAKGVLAVLDEAGDGIERRVGRYLNGIRLQVTVEDE